MSVQSPDAYREMQEDKASIRAEQEPEDPEEKRKREIRCEATESYLDSIEKPLFSGGQQFGDYMDSLLGTAWEDVDKANPSLHNNSES